MDNQLLDVILDALNTANLLPELENNLSSRIEGFY
jgi:hypothetical protein